MPKGRLEAFSDGVIAIIITIMVLEIKTPDGSSPRDLMALLPSFLSYALSFFFVGVYWNNHHHLLNLVQKVNGRMLWANLLFLFVLSLVPVATDWIDRTAFAAFPTIAYAVLNVLVSLAYMNLERLVRCSHGIPKETGKVNAPDLTSEEIAILRRRSYAKERYTIYLEVLSLVLAWLLPSQRLAYVAIVASIGLWIVPDLRIVHALDWLAEEEGEED